ncbi:ABC transporter substrate-binding protein [Pseudomonas chengduensis]|nr:ABC transporter substrate-binding protein [Pseudomonas chengduensis]MDH1866526.1 ABC transporter substrate-binding protein [Pseudomonas chengduensis]
MINRRQLLQSLPLALLATTPWARWVQAAESGRDSLTIAYPIDVASWDPLTMNPLQSALIQCVFDQPIALNADLSQAPSPVHHLRWLDQHCQQLLLRFRPGMRFHDGSVFTAADFQFSFLQRAQVHPATLLAGVWSLIDRIELRSALDAVVHFHYPMATAPAMLADIPSFIVSQAAYQQRGSAGFSRHPIGSGPYRLVDYQRGSRIVLEAFDDYWLGRPTIRRVVVLIAGDTVARAAMVQGGQADVAIDLGVREALKLGQERGLRSQIHPTTAIVQLQMVNRGVLSDRNVRLALHHAINKPLISQGLFLGHATPISVPAGPDMPGHVTDFSFPYDPQRAQQLLHASGYTAQNPLALSLYSSKGALAQDVEMAQAIQFMWQQVGIQVELKLMTPPMLASAQQQGRIDGPLLQGWNPAAGDPGTYSGYLLHPDLSFALWKSPDVAERLYPLMAEPDADKRLQGLRDFDRWQVEQGYSIPLFQRQLATVHRSDLHWPSRLTGLMQPRQAHFI